MLRHSEKDKKPLSKEVVLSHSLAYLTSWLLQPFHIQLMLKVALTIGHGRDKEH